MISRSSRATNERVACERCRSSASEQEGCETSFRLGSLLVIAVEPVIGHVKAEHRLGRNYLKGRDGDRSNAVLAAAGYNFSLLLRWLARLLRALIRALFPAALAVRIA